MTLADTLIPRKPPLVEDDHGVVRVGGTRVTLQSVIRAYQSGASAEEIALAFDVLSLADVHAVLSYYLLNHEQVDQYLAEQQRQAEDARMAFPPKASWQQVRDRLRCRQQGRT